MPTEAVLRFMRGEKPAGELKLFLKALAKSPELQRDLLSFHDSRTPLLRRLWEWTRFSPAAATLKNELPSLYSRLINGARWIPPKFDLETKRLHSEIVNETGATIHKMLAFQCRHFGIPHTMDIEHDLIVDTFLQFLKNREEGKYREEGLRKQYFTTIARVLAIQRIRDIRLDLDRLIPDAQEEHLLGKAEGELTQAMDEETQARASFFALQCLEELAPEDRAIFNMRHFGKRLKPAQIAEETGRSAREVTVSLNQSRAFLQKCIAKRQCADQLPASLKTVYHKIFIEKTTIEQYAKAMNTPKQKIETQVELIRKAFDDCTRQKTPWT